MDWVQPLQYHVRHVWMNITKNDTSDQHTGLFPMRKCKRGETVSLTNVKVQWYKTQHDSHVSKRAWLGLWRVLVTSGGQETSSLGFKGKLPSTNQKLYCANDRTSTQKD
ncbi:hypothetical protein KIN20_037739 [Parelaphostrongylus tenuis]|uniref:Uncharacterized protein n=1 Tax=Parelaphostrongylus tenuis TaxID=148309 RepID=A0AAD5REW8_PARTN|nr:hypothetical protein KIN20_037739 [Parelaphostrongylus tenuis]